MIKTGVSVFAGLDDYSLEENISYLKSAKKAGCECVFSSAHIGEAKQAWDELQTIIDTSIELGMKLSLDVSKPMMANFKIPHNLYALRLDYGFTDEDIIEMSNYAPFMVELNASTISKEHLEKLIRDGINFSNTRISFNYYPKLYTGHDILDVLEKTILCRSVGIEVAAFVPSQVGFRPPMYEGLPTVESHRNLKLDLAIEELKACGVDAIYFGDAYASLEEITILNKHKDDALMLNIRTEFKQLIKEDYLYKIRIDLNSYMLRVGNSRSKEVIEPFNTVKRLKYDVTVDNTLFKRYQGELNIILQDLPSDERVNVIGHLVTTDFIIEQLKKGREFKFIIEK